MLFYKLKDKIIDVLNFKTNHGQLIYKNKSKQIFCNDSIISENVLDEIYIKDNYVIFNRKNITNIIDLKTLIGTKIDDLEVLNTYNYNNNSIILIDQKQTLFQFDIAIQQKIKLDLKEYNWGLIILYQNNLIIIDRYSINCYILPTATPLWQYDLSGLGEYTPFRSTNPKLYEVLKFIDVWQEQLLVACSDGLILCLDIQTGDEIRRFQQCPPYAIGSITREKFHDANAFVLDGSKNILMALNSYFYMEIDLNTNAVKIIDIRENMAEVNIDFLRQSRDYAWDDNYIYSIGNVAKHTSGIAKGDRCILAFNRHTYKIDWQYIFEDDSINTDIPQLAGNKLYQLTANKVLHIFEKAEV